MAGPTPAPPSPAAIVTQGAAAVTAVAHALWPYAAAGYAIWRLCDPTTPEAIRPFLQGLYSVALVAIDPNNLVAPRPQA